MPIHLKYLLIRKLENILNEKVSMNKVVKYNPKKLMAMQMKTISGIE